MSHTNGKLTADHAMLFDMGGKEVGLILGRKEVFLPNARRLVACWNACDGLPQDALDGGWTAAGISKYAKGLEEERDELLAALERLERVSGQAMTQDDPDRAAARAILAKYSKAES